MSDAAQLHAKEETLKVERLSDLLDRGVDLVETAPAEALTILQQVQQSVAQRSLFSKNEELSDISTKTLPYLALEHHLALCYLNQPTNSQEPSQRHANLQRCCDLWSAFLQRLEQVELLNSDEVKQYHDLIEWQASLSQSASSDMSLRTRLPPTDRDAKIRRFKTKQAALEEKVRLQSLLQRRQRLELKETDDLDGYDDESLWRSVHLQTLQVYKADAMEEWASVLREIPMIQLMMHRANGTWSPKDARAPLPRERPPLQVTHITQDAASGQMRVRREEVRSQVFRPHWQQPTMSLEELAEREVDEAMERERRQIQAEENQKDLPRRFDLLRKDGLEDDADLVDASAALDRQWDDWKDANPRGSGNKRGDQGDRNF